MILKGSQRAGAKALAFHLLRLDENDHVDVHDVRGFVSDDLTGALTEAYAVSKGTRCRQFLFSLSLSPPATADVPKAVFEKAIVEIEEWMGLQGQPRVIVFHEKEGRRHAHCVWSRIKADELKAINIPHFKLKLREVSRQLYVEHGWKMPRGLVNTGERNPLNFTREEWQQAKRAGRDPKAIKQVFLDCWAISDDLKSFRAAMEARGFYLARGHRRGHVAIDWQGEIYAISRWAGVKAKDVRSKLGDPADLPEAESVKADVLSKMEGRHRELKNDIEREFGSARLGLRTKLQKLVSSQREERALLAESQRIRWAQEQVARAERFRRGLKGLWDRLTGRHKRVAEENADEIRLAQARDDTEVELLNGRQREDRRFLGRQLRNLERRRSHEIEALFEPESPDQASSPAPNSRPGARHKKRAHQGQLLLGPRP